LPALKKNCKRRANMEQRKEINFPVWWQSASVFGHTEMAGGCTGTLPVNTV
jgi:hypothetical protein